jgi:hypothetical protein
MDSRRGSHRVTKKTIQISLYSNSENALAWIDQYYGESELSGQLQVLNKVKFRELIKSYFPTFISKISIEEIQRLSDDEIRFPFVIKPAVGFFSIGVHIVENEKTDKS